MAYTGVEVPISGLKANADLSSYQHRFCKLTSGKVTYCNTTGEQAIGVLGDKPSAANQAAFVASSNGNITKVEAGAAVAQGATVMTDTVGRAITWTSTYSKLGIALNAASAAGEKIEVILLSTGTDVDSSKGVIQLDITALREIATNDTQNLAAHGGIMASDSTPALARVNGATDKALRLAWAAADVTEVQFPTIALPHDLDAASDMTIHLYGKMAGSTDTPTVDCQVFFNEGDTECGAASSAFGSTLAEETATVASADIPAAPGFMNVALVPGAHGTDILYLYAAWIEYAKIVN